MYKLEILYPGLITRIVHGLKTEQEAREYVRMEGDHVLEYNIIEE